MTLHGPTYPSSTTLEPTPQEFVLTLLCATEAAQPEFKSYDGARALVEWAAPAGCNFRSDPSNGGDGKTPDKEAEAVGSGIGWFFLLFVFPFASKDDKYLTLNIPSDFSSHLQVTLHLAHIITIRRTGLREWISFRVFLLPCYLWPLY